jgi:hypothetical protein
MINRMPSMDQTNHADGKAHLPDRNRASCIGVAILTRTLVVDVSVVDVSVVDVSVVDVSVVPFDATSASVHDSP